MQQDLHQILKVAGCDVKLISFLEKEQCLTIGLCADWFDTPEEVSVLVASAGLEEKFVKAQSAMLKGVRRQLKARVDRATKRMSEGLAADETDELLSTEAHKDMMTAASSFWKWPRFDARAIVCDRQISNMRREFQNFQPTLLIIMKLKLFSETQRASTPKKQRVSDRVQLVIDSAEDTTAAADLFTWLELFEVAITSFSVACCFDVTYNLDGESSNSAGPQFEFC